MRFAHPENLWSLLAVGALAVFLYLSDRRRRQHLGQFVGSAMLTRLNADYSPARAAAKLGLALAALVCLAIGLAGPQWGMQTVRVERQGVDIVIAMDCSASMQARDVKPSRMELARRELGQLIDQLEGNRLGLVGFAGSAFAFCPLTLDISATHLFLDQLDSNAMPVPGTSLGDAIRTAMDCFPAGDSNRKILVLLTDGEDHHSDPLGAAKEAAKAGITVYTVGIGNQNGEPIPAEGGFVQDEQGKVVMSRLDETTLQQIAKETGGKYVHVDGTSSEALAPVLSAISGTERHKLEERLQRQGIERFQILLGLALFLLAGERLLTTKRKG